MSTKNATEDPTLERLLEVAAWVSGFGSFQPAVQLCDALRASRAAHSASPPSPPGALSGEQEERVKFLIGERVCDIYDALHRTWDRLEKLESAAQLRQGGEARVREIAREVFDHRPYPDPSWLSEIIIRLNSLEASRPLPSPAAPGEQERGEAESIEAAFSNWWPHLVQTGTRYSDSLIAFRAGWRARGLRSAPGSEKLREEAL